jgi:ABC-type uncharacterized transport system YnjBCD ATPase subunit
MATFKRIPPEWADKWKAQAFKKKAALVDAEQQRDALLAELRNIADAKPWTWDKNMRDQFRQWAQSRARAAIVKAEGQAK